MYDFTANMYINVQRLQFVCYSFYWGIHVSLFCRAQFAPFCKYNQLPQGHVNLQIAAVWLKNSDFSLVFLKKEWTSHFFFNSPIKFLMQSY